MLDERQRSELWRTIRRLDRAEKQRLVDELRQSLDTAPSEGDTSNAAPRDDWRRMCAEMDAIRDRSRPGPPSIVQIIAEGRRH